ncbi:ABC transporter ATP-binding protein [Desulfobacter hydrogenophilus]|uniref:ABC transporter ATP-binding protein n=1 Tax=Desulfobacter hydrogenophilus TaxID=2291 RepID=A0A328FDA6_9BACT|nr:ABC transporter ATP-binding protein [Desulfobacter hydrogenophilus]NDY74181.1 ABC transporter ATP-binding protein [Desulfobacter hydrogenophilus]QBH12042.1 ABC transporter ATP-binding protein [Desulfobacter hydrogenophilus]RAM02598.1 ABC transporter ATP-binding protein [Desulfobacter hydrogenophilus]
METVLLRTDHLTHAFGSGDTGIFDICLTVARDDFIVLAGKNGCGKTTLIRHFNGLLMPDNGRILLNGQDIQKDLTLARKKIGMVFQDPDTQIIADSVFDEIAFGPENLNMDREEINDKVSIALNMLDLSHLRDRNPATLSGGEKRRLAIAGILVMEPDLIIFDEPFANLDYPSILSLVKLCQKLHQSGHAIVMTTHDVAPVITLATKMMVMDKGRIKAEGDPVSLAPCLESYGVKNPFTPMAQAWAL